MKLVKLFNKLSAVALAASLVVGFASCSTTTDDPFNPNAPLTLEEYVKSEIKKAIENGGAQAKPEDPSKLEFESRTSLMDKIQLNNDKTEDAWGNGTKISSANPLQASEGYGWDKENGQISLPFAYDAGYFGENTHIIIEADDSALNYNADAAIKIEFKVENPSTGHSNEMNITSKFKDGVAIIPISEIGFTDSCQFLLTFRAKGTVTITKIEMAKAKGQSAPETTPGEEQKPGENPTPTPDEKPEPGKPSGSGSLKEPKSLEFHVNANSTNAENTMIFVKYDRSAYGAEEEVKVTDAELNLYINDVKVKTYNEIVFALDEYGAEITSRGGPISDPKAMKEYKAKLSVGKAVKSGETVKIELVKASVVKVGAASGKITLADLQFALIDTDPSVDYYKELAPNAEQFQNICTAEDLTTGEDTESKPEPTPTPGEEEKPGEKPEPGEESARPAIGDVVYSATGDSLTVVLPQNIYGEPAISHGIQVTKVGILPKGAKAGETYKIVLKGTASGAFSANVQFLDKGWQGLGDEATVANFTTEDFNITAYYTFGFDTEDGYMFVIGNDDAECTEKTLALTEFSITRENKPAGGENNAGGEGDNGAGESTSKTYGLCKKYTVTTTKDVAAGNFAFVLQIDNDGEQSEDGLKIDVTDFEMEVKVGNDEPFTYKSDKIAMIPNQWAYPNYGVTDCRFKLDGEKTIPSGTVITVQVKKATVSNKGKADSIIYIFNEDGVDGQYGQYVAPSDNYKPIFAANEI